MRGPLLSGAVGSAVTLRRLTEILRAVGPTVVVRSPWLGLSLSSELSVVALVPPAARAAARRRRRRKSAGLLPTLFAVSGAPLPIGAGTAGSLVAADLAEIEPGALVTFLLEIAGLVKPGGLLVALDRTKDAATEARLAWAFLASGFLGIVQERPREGALLTHGRPPPALVRDVLARAARPDGAAGLAGAE